MQIHHSLMSINKLQRNVNVNLCNYCMHVVQLFISFIPINMIHTNLMSLFSLYYFTRLLIHLTSFQTLAL